VLPNSSTASSHRTSALLDVFAVLVSSLIGNSLASFRHSYESRVPMDTASFNIMCYQYCWLVFLSAPAGRILPQTQLCVIVRERKTVRPIKAKFRMQTSRIEWCLLSGACRRTTERDILIILVLWFKWTQKRIAASFPLLCFDQRLLFKSTRSISSLHSAPRK